MESKSTFKQPPVETFQPDVSCEDVKRDEKPNENLLGAVVVGGRISADCFIPWDEKKPHIVYEIGDID